jgi:hypothetical protein
MDTATAWYANLKKIEWKSPKALTVGAKVAFEARFMGRTMAYTYEIRNSSQANRYDEHGGGTLPDGDQLHILRAARRSWSYATGAARQDSGPSSPP